MSDHNYEFVIIGGGSAAFSAALTANKLGVKTALIEKGVVGGTCVNIGCVPTKYLINVANRHYYATRKTFAGLVQKSELDFTAVIEGKNKLIEKLRSEKYEDVLTSMGRNVDFMEGTARLLEPHKITVDGQEILAKKILIATGASAFIPPISGLDSVGYLTSATAQNLKSLPQSLLVIGGGTIGLEFAQMFARFGSKVTLIQDLPKILPKAEPEISDGLLKQFSSEKIRIYTGSLVESVRGERGKIITRVQTGKDILDITTDNILIASGRRANTKDLGLQDIGVDLGKKGEVLVDKSFRTSIDHIFAAGDVTGIPMLETVAAREGRYAAENALTLTVKSIDYGLVPRTIYTSPEFSTVGLTERAATENGIEALSKITRVDLLPKAHISGHKEGLIKLVISKHGQKIIGAHILSHDSSSIIQEAVIAQKYGLSVNDIATTPHVFPAMTELMKFAAQSFYEDVSKHSCCTD